MANLTDRLDAMAMLDLLHRLCRIYGTPYEMRDEESAVRDEYLRKLRWFPRSAVEAAVEQLIDKSGTEGYHRFPKPGRVAELASEQVAADRRRYPKPPADPRAATCKQCGATFRWHWLVRIDGTVTERLLMRHADDQPCGERNRVHRWYEPAMSWADGEAPLPAKPKYAPGYEPPRTDADV